MLLKEIINKSIYGTIGYIASQDDLDRLESYILYNLPIIKEFKKVIIATNFGSPLQDKNKDLWEKYFPNCTLLDSPLNRGHNHGYADLDNLLFDWCKENNIEWLCKGANDVLFQSKLLDIEIEEADFYYLNGFSFETTYIYNFDPQKLNENHFTPQTNFYLINVSKTDYLTNKEYLSETYEITKTIPNYNNKPWEYIKGWSCEDFLAQCVERNNLTKSHILDEDHYLKLFNTIKGYKIGDPSHKNIFLRGICHFQFPDQPVLEI